MSSQFGKIFAISTWGESHGGGVGVVIDGCPPGLDLDESVIQAELDRRRPGQSDLVTPRKETDTCEILSGVFEGKTLGSPIAVLVRNQDARSSAYEEMAVKYRPSHADYTYDRKYGRRAWAGGGRASARETIGRVAGGAVAKLALTADFPDLEIVAWVETVKDVSAGADPALVSKSTVESNAVRAPDEASAAAMRKVIEAARSEGNSVGGIVSCVVRNCPAGLGEPVFDKLEADLARAMLSLPAVKGFEIGSGFAGTLLTGREHNDAFTNREGEIRTLTNRSGGVQGGISNGEDIVFRVAFKPTATIMTEQETIDQHGENTTLKGRGRHDACVLPRAVPIVESMVWLVLCDHWLRQRGQCGGLPEFPAV